LALLVPGLSVAAPSLRCAGIHSLEASAFFEAKVQKSLDDFLRQFGVDPNWQETRIYENNKRSGHCYFNGFSRIDELNQADIFHRHGGDPKQIQYVLYRDKKDEKSSTTDIPAIKSNFPYPEFLGEIWSWKDDSQQEHRYRFANVGFRQMKQDWPLIESAVLAGLKNAPEGHLVMTLNPQMVLGRSILATWRKWNSQKVTDVYKKRKNYLASDDLYDLRETDRRHSQTDEYLVLMKDQGLLPIEMTSKQYEENLMAVVRLVRMEESDPYFPSNVFGAWKGSFLRLPVTERNDQSRVGQRLSGALNGLVLAGKRVAEISRFVKFQKFPEPIKDAFLKNLFELSIRPQDPIDILVISVDAKTQSLFSRYRFKDLIPLNDGDRSTAEYVMYMDTQSAEFKATLSELRDRSKFVMRNQEITKPAQSRWASLWGETPGASIGSGYEKHLEGHRQVKLQRERVKRLNARHVPWNIANLSEQRPADKNRVEEIVNWVVSGPSMPLQLSRRLEKLTTEDQENLYRNVSLFSRDFENAVGHMSDAFPIQGKMLIYQKGPENFVEMISSEYEGRNVQQGDLQRESTGDRGSYDGVLIVGIYENLKSDPERLALLQRAAMHLRSGGLLTIIGPFKFGPDAQGGWGQTHLISEDNIPKTNFDLALLKYAQKLFESDAPMSERDLALDLGLRRRFYEIRLNSNMGAVAISYLARTVGFTNSHSSQDMGTYDSRVITLQRE